MREREYWPAEKEDWWEFGRRSLVEDFVLITHFRWALNWQLIHCQLCYILLKCSARGHNFIYFDSVKAAQMRLRNRELDIFNRKLSQHISSQLKYLLTFFGQRKHGFVWSSLY